MNTKPSLGTGFAAVWAHAVAAGIIASSRGKARVARALLRKVRLGIAFFVKNIGLSFHPPSPVTRYLTGYRCHLSVPHLKRNTLHDSENERREPVSVLLRVAHDFANGWGVVILDASSQ